MEAQAAAEAKAAAEVEAAVQAAAEAEASTRAPAVECAAAQAAEEEVPSDPYSAKAIAHRQRKNKEAKERKKQEEMDEIREKMKQAEERAQVKQKAKEAEAEQKRKEEFALIQQKVSSAKQLDAAAAAEELSAAGAIATAPDSPASTAKAVIDPATPKAEAATEEDDDEEPWTPAAVLSAQRTRSEVETLVARFTDAADDDGRVVALDELREMASEAYGADAAAVGAAVRDSSAIPALTACINSDSMELQQMALALLGNLLTDIFDLYARKSLGAFADSGGLEALVARLRSEYPVNLFVLAALQNVTSLDPWHACTSLRALGCVNELVAMMKDIDDTMLTSYVTAVLANLRAQDPEPEANPELEEAIRMRRLASIVERMQTGRAVNTMQRLASRWLQRHRARKAMQAAIQGDGAAADGSEDKPSQHRSASSRLEGLRRS